MRCKSCNSDLVIPAGKTSGYCVECGTGWTVDPERGAVLDDEVIERIAEAVARRIAKPEPESVPEEKTETKPEVDDVWER